MRLLMLSEFYPPLIGGIERHVQTFSQEMVRRGHRVAVATLHQPGQADRENDCGVHLYRLKGWNRLLASFYENRHRQYHLPLPDPGIVSALRQVIEEERPDIVHARRWMLYSFATIKAWSKARLVVTLHDYSLICPTSGFLFHNQACSGPQYIKCLRCTSSQYGIGKAALVTTGLKGSSFLHNQVDRYIAVSSAVKEASLRGTGRPPRTIEVVPSFIPNNVLAEARSVARPAFLPPTDTYILFVGRHTAAKGLDVLLEAYQGLADLAPLVLMLAEEGAATRSFPVGVTVVRNVPHAQVMAGWLHCAVGVVPSRWPEPFGQVVVEAMTCGKPVVASAIGGIRDLIVDGESGLLVEPGNADALREALRGLLLDPARRASMGDAGRQQARQYTVSAVAERIEAIYRDVLRSQTGRKEKPCQDVTSG